MANDSSELFSAGTGQLYRGAVGASAPATLMTDPAEATWADLGYATPEGAGFESAPEFTGIFAWQSRRKLRNIAGETSETLTITLMQLTRYNVQTLFGGGTFVESPTDIYTYTPPAPEDRDEFALLLDADDGDYRIRWHFRKVSNTSTANIMFNREGISELALTLEVLDPGAGQDAWTFKTNLPSFEDLGS